MFSVNRGSGESGSHVVVALHGELDLVDAQAAADALVAVAARGPRIIVELSGLEFIDASGIAALSRGRSRADPASAARMRWRRIAMNARSEAASGDKRPALRRLAGAIPPPTGAISG